MSSSIQLFSISNEVKALCGSSVMSWNRTRDRFIVPLLAWRKKMTDTSRKSCNM